MKIDYKELQKRKNIVIWGVGKTLEKYIKRISPDLDVIGLCDSDISKCGNFLLEGKKFFSKNDLEKKHTVIIAIQHLKALEEVVRELEERKLDYCHITEAVEGYNDEWEKKEISKYDNTYGTQEMFPEKVVKFINCHIPYKFCNLQCSYCYIRQVRGFEQQNLKLHSPEFIRRALSRKRLGGTAFINFCAGGETMMVTRLIPIVEELVKEGHYIQIVTNGTITKGFLDLLNTSIDKSHLFIKFSFHYLELKRLGLLARFTENVNLVKKAGCSISVEITTEDGLIPYIEEVKEYAYRYFGALPHITIARNDTTEGIEILSELDEKEYYNVWKDFSSELFEFKFRQVGRKQNKYCNAGKRSFQMNLETGEVYKCVGNPYMDNIYENICREIRFSAVGTECKLPYCYNGHAYLTFGLVEEEEAPTYYDVRDRVQKDGTHWITEKMKNVMNVKLYDTNRQQESGED